MKVIVVGCGRFGVELAYRLHERGDQVAVLDVAPEAFNHLPANFRGRQIEGDALNQDVLQRAGIQEADAVAVVTNSDVVNLVVGRIAQEVYRVPIVIARNYEMFTRSLYELFNIQVVSAASWGTQRVVEMMNHSKAHLVYSAGNGEVGIYEFVIPLEWVGKTLQEVVEPMGGQPIALTRGGRAIVPEMNTTLNCGDVLSVSTSIESAEIMRHKLNSLRQEAC
jgi:trk system potassium uptake protein